MRIRMLAGTAMVAAAGAAGGATAYLFSPAPSAMAPAAARLASASRPATDVTTPAPPRCDDGAWKVDDVSVQGRPDGFDAGDDGATYIWHDGDGWHLRTTDRTDRGTVYSGTIALSPGARFTDVAPVRIESGDHVDVDRNNVLHYRFVTHDGIDGVDFHVSACDGARAVERMTFHLRRGGEDDSTARIDLGDSRRHPESDPFVAVRSV